ncbi:MAG: hypothetical protein CMH56_05495 [Myxococcales bacterium]|nr:hypothetical protein [Myxococcales bacterium]
MIPPSETQLSLFGTTTTRLEDKDPPPPAKGTTAAKEKTANTISHSKMVQDTLKQFLGPKTQLVWTDNKSVLLSQGSGKNKHTFRMHQMFMEADEKVIVAIGRYFKTGHKPSGQLVDTFIKAHSHLLMHHEGSLPLNTGKGEHHDLHVIQEALSRIYFNGKVNLDIQWGRPRRQKRGRRSIQLGSYDARVQRITIHPSLDKAFIPEMCVARIVHHEMCHHVYPAQRSPSGRRMVHHKTFLEAEAQFVGAEEADAWLDRNLNKILRG